MKLQRMHLSLLLSAVAITAAWAVRTQAPALTAEMKASTIANLSKAMVEDYVFPELGQKAAKDLEARHARKEYDGIKSGQEFSAKLTEHLNAICKDAHLSVRFSEKPLPLRTERREPSPEEIKKAAIFERRLNGGFEKLERLPGNIGYIEIMGFVNKQVAARAAEAAMNWVAETDALIIDLRRNGGGSPQTVQLICSYLFEADKPVHLNSLYFRKGDRTEEFWTLKDVPGQRYLNKPVYVLTSKRTGSGAEEFSYNLKNLKRATLVGESTWGGANPGGVVRLNDHFSAFIPTGRAINPITKTNWEGTGVQPDIAVAADQALKVARLEILKGLQAKSNDSEDKEWYGRLIKELESAPAPSK